MGHLFYKVIWGWAKNELMGLKGWVMLFLSSKRALFSRAKKGVKIWYTRSIALSLEQGG